MMKIYKKLVIYGAGRKEKYIIFLKQEKWK